MVAALLTAVSLSPPATAAPPQPDRATVEQLLSGVEDLPTRQDLLRLGAGVDAVLRQIVEHPSARALARTRAITALRFFPSKTTRTTLLAVIAQGRGVTRPSLALLDLEQAAVAYAIVAGPAALAALEPLLIHANLDVRASAAEAVRRTGHPRAEALLARRARLDPSATVRQQIQRELTRLRRARRMAAQPR